MTTYPNQRTVIIQKEKCSEDFLQINNEEWRVAANTLQTYSTFKLYLYFASNKNNYIVALSPSAVEDAIGISKNTYRAAFAELLKYGYLKQVDEKKNQYIFYTKI